VSATLAAAGAVHLVTAAAFVAVGRRFHRLKTAEGARLARRAFVAWWWGFAAYLFGAGSLDLLAAAGVRPLVAFVAFRAASGLLLAAAAWGLAYHILYLWSGRQGWALPLAFYYGAAGAAYTLLVLLSHPAGVTVTAWSAEVQYVVPPQGALWDAVLASVGLPLVLGSLAYLGLALKAHDRERRYRIILVGGSLLLWVVSGFAAEVGGSEAARFAAIVLLGLLSAAAVTAAYHPPSPVRRWLGKGAAGSTDAAFA
jgi:hypothetical protein